MTPEQTLDAWIDAHFDEEVRTLQALVQVPTDTPPGNNAPHAERTAQLLAQFGFTAERHPVPAERVQAAQRVLEATGGHVQRHVGPVEAHLAQRGVLHPRRARMGDGVADHAEQSGGAADHE